VDRLLLLRLLEYTRGNLQQAALLLGIARQTLRLKLRDRVKSSWFPSTIAAINAAVMVFYFG
jgi:hypothetical protein